MLGTTQALPASADLLPRFDELFGPRWGVDMDSLINDLFAAGFTGPIQSPFDGGVLAFRNKDLRTLAARPALGNVHAHLQVPEEMPNFRRISSNHIFMMKPPTYDAMRGIFAPHFLADRLTPFKQAAEDGIRTAMSSVAGRGKVDFHHDVALPAAMHLWGQVYRVTPEELEQAKALIPLFYTANYFDGVDVESVETWAAEFLALMQSAIQRTMDNDPPDYLATMMREFEALTIEKPDALASTLAAQTLDGFHSMSVAFTSTLRELLVRPEQWELVQEDPKLVTNAYSEGTRLAPPTSFTNRFAYEDVEYNGLHIPAGHTVTMVWFAGNRDPEVFKDPTRYDLFRRAAGQTTFGGGTHLCPGRNMARMYIETSLACVTAPEYQVLPAGPSDQWVGQSGEVHLRELPVSVERV